MFIHGNWKNPVEAVGKETKESTEEDIENNNTLTVQTKQNATGWMRLQLGQWEGAFVPALTLPSESWRRSDVPVRGTSSFPTVRLAGRSLLVLSSSCGQNIRIKVNRSLFQTRNSIPCVKSSSYHWLPFLVLDTQTKKKTTRKENHMFLLPVAVLVLVWYHLGILALVPPEVRFHRRAFQRRLLWKDSRKKNCMQVSSKAGPPCGHNFCVFVSNFEGKSYDRLKRQSWTRSVPVLKMSQFCARAAVTWVFSSVPGVTRDTENWMARV